MKQIDKLVIALIFILFTLNLLTLFQYSVTSFRVCRIVASASFFIFFAASIKKKSSLSFLVLFLMLTSDFMLLNYEVDYFKIFHYVLRGCSYLLIAYQIKKAIKQKISDIFSRLFLLLVVVFIMFLLYTVGEIFSLEDHSFLIVSLFYFQGTAASFMFIVAVYFLSNSSSRFAIYTFFPSLAFIIADLSAFAAYHLDFSYFYVFDRLFYILALGSYIKYQYETEKLPFSKKILEEDI